MSTEDKLEPIRVKLLKWHKPDHNSVYLLFEKVQLYTSTRRFTAEGLKVKIWDDFGYLKIKWNW